MTVVTNEGTAVIWPIFYVYGDGANSWSITNNSILDDFGNPLSFVYDPLPIGPAFAIPLGAFAIVDMFENTIILSSSGATMQAGLVMQETDFFPLVPGGNNITKTGGMTLEIVRPVTAWA